MAIGIGSISPLCAASLTENNNCDTFSQTSHSSVSSGKVDKVSCSACAVGLPYAGRMLATRELWPQGDNPLWRNRQPMDWADDFAVRACFAVLRQPPRLGRCDSRRPYAGLRFKVRHPACPQLLLLMKLRTIRAKPPARDPPGSPPFLFAPLLLNSSASAVFQSAIRSELY